MVSAIPIVVVARLDKSNKFQPRQDQTYCKARNGLHEVDDDHDADSHAHVMNSRHGRSDP